MNKLILIQFFFFGKIFILLANMERSQVLYSYCYLYSYNLITYFRNFMLPGTSDGRFIVMLMTHVVFGLRFFLS